MAYEVEFDRVGFAIIPIYVRHKQAPTMASVDYKVDTGANCTTIGFSRLSELGYDAVLYFRSRLDCFQFIRS